MASSHFQPQAQTSQTRARVQQSQIHPPGQQDSPLLPPPPPPVAPATGTHRQNPTTATTTISLTPSRFLYVHLHPVTNPPLVDPQSVALDETTLRLHLLSAASSYLGDTGAAIPVDVLAVRPAVVVRVPREDGPGFLAAVASWVGGGASAASSDVVGYVVRAKSDWLAELLGSAEGDVDGLFDFTQ